ncbi:pseudouridine synthase [Chloropicon primus]|uniref:Pseudouridine synthase n=1 Tax=Chloropicon primus TaxID=1764295 RepID=A0A5B8MII2_9CHLO|nr:pseudouridine synthase [Chloropicon primus]UPQ99085.1 pseudouridine synthase [Chloropicon primus]|eukprot:QDZ19874.1 pseudouridine synthase [Chloropicon primus]
MARGLLVSRRMCLSSLARGRTAAAPQALRCRAWCSSPSDRDDGASTSGRTATTREDEDHHHHRKGGVVDGGGRTSLFVVPGGVGGRGSKGAVRLDAFLSDQLVERNLSRARIQESVRAGTATVNGRVQVKPAYKLRPGDEVVCEILDRPPLDVEPEDIPLDVVYEDDCLLVVDKPAGLVVHPAPGNHGGTLVNAVLHHCNLPGLRVGGLDEGEDGEGEGNGEGASSPHPYRKAELMYGSVPVPRPGIVHRLDKGTSGLMVVAKDDLARESLQLQFRERTVERKYLSILCGQIQAAARGGEDGVGAEGRVVTAIGRDRRERTRMAAFPIQGVEHKPHLKRASSRYSIQEVLAGGAASLVSWRLETGRTHQIRVHAKFLNAPLLGDVTYGGRTELAGLGTMQRPALHAATLGFDHPKTGKRLKFERDAPEDFLAALRDLRRHRQPTST